MEELNHTNTIMFSVVEPCCVSLLVVMNFGYDPKRSVILILNLSVCMGRVNNSQEEKCLWILIFRSEIVKDFDQQTSLNFSQFGL